MTRPPVIIATTYYQPVLGGAEVAAQRLAEYLARRGHRVLVLTKRTSRRIPARESIAGVDVERLAPIGERTGRGKWAVLPSVFAALLRHRADADVVCCIDYRGIGLAALAARWRTGVPVVFQAQTEGVISGARLRSAVARAGARPDGGIAAAFTWPIRALYRRADAIGCISRGIEQETLDAGVPRARVHYLPNPVHHALFAASSAADRKAVRRREGIDAAATVAIFVGRLSREKGALELVQAWARARPAGFLVVIGPAMTGHPWDVSGEVRGFVERQGLASQIRLLGGQPTPVVVEWLKAADFAVQPSRFEAMGLAAAEAMAAGLPVIATATGGFRDFVVHDRTGLLVPVGDEEALAAAIARLAGDAALRARLGAAARDAARQFDEEIVLEQFARIIDDLALKRAQPPGVERATGSGGTPSSARK